MIPSEGTLPALTLPVPIPMDPFEGIEDDEDELEANKVLLEDC